MKTGWKIFFAVLFAVTMLPAIVFPAQTPRWVGLLGFITFVVGGGLTLRAQFKESNARWAKVREVLKERERAAQQTNEPPKPDADA